MPYLWLREHHMRKLAQIDGEMHSRSYRYTAEPRLDLQLARAIVDVLDGDLIHAKRQRDDAREMWPPRLETEGNIYFTGLRGVQTMQMKPPNKQEAARSKSSTQGH